MSIPLLFLVLRRNEIVESEDKREDKDVDGVLTDVSCETFVMLGDDDDDGSSKIDEFDGGGSFEANEVDDGSSIIDEIDDDSSEGQLEAEG